MAWLEADAKPISYGWGSEPQLHAPDISGMVRAILQNRQWQQENTQKNMADAIKQIQSQRQAGAYGQALQNAGVIYPGIDTSNMSSPQLTALAQQIQEQTPDEEMDAYHKAAAAKEQAIADAIKNGTYSGRGGIGRGGSMVTVTDENGEPVTDVNGNPVQVPAGSRLGQQVIADQGNITTPPSASVAANIAAKMNLPPQSITNQAQHQGMGFVPSGDPGWAKGQTGPVDQQGNPTNYLPVSPGDEPTDIKVSPSGVDPKTQQPYQPVIVQRNTLEQLRRALQGSSYRPPRGPQPSDVNDQAPLPQSAPSPTPSATPPPSGAPPADTAAGHASNYGVQQNNTVAASRDAAAIGQLYLAPDGSTKRRMD